MAGNKIELDRKKITERSRITCIQTRSGTKIKCFYDYDDVLGTGDSKVVFKTKRRDPEILETALNIAQFLHRRYHIPFAIIYDIPDGYQTKYHR